MDDGAWDLFLKYYFNVSRTVIIVLNDSTFCSGCRSKEYPHGQKSAMSAMKKDIKIANRYVERVAPFIKLLLLADNQLIVIQSFFRSFDDKHIASITEHVTLEVIGC